MRARVSVDTTDLDRALEARLERAEKRARQIMERVGKRTVEYLAGYTTERRPGGRRAHPGGWGDVTGELADSYRYEVDVSANGVTLDILNDSRHALKVEVLDGFFVVRGVAEPGGPAHEAFVKAVRDIAPDWEVRR